MSHQAGVPALSYPCAGCGARVEYVPGTDVLRCPYCGHEQAVAGAGRPVREHPIGELTALPRRPVASVGAHTFVCRGCGARTESDAQSWSCQFCGAALVVDPDAVALVAPEAVLPFSLDRGGVRAALRAWVRSRHLAPSGLKKVSDAESTKGTYIPHWTFDAATASDYRGQRGEHYWVTETYTTTDADGRARTQTRQVMHTRWYPVSGTVGRRFDDILVSATGRVTADQLDGLAPWPLARARAYQPDYLAGYHTLRYEVEPEAGLDTAKQRMAPVIERDCRDDIGGDEQRVRSVRTRYSDVTYKLMLLPVWLVLYVYSGRTYQVLINGTTGAVVGQRPYSAAKIAALITAATLVITAVVLLVVVGRHG